MIYSELAWIHRRIPAWYFRMLARLAIRQVEKRDCHYPYLRSAPKLAPAALDDSCGADNTSKPEWRRLDLHE